MVMQGVCNGGKSQSGLLIVMPIYNSVHVITNKELVGIIFSFIELSTVSEKSLRIFVLCLKSYGVLELNTHSQNTGAAQ